MAGFAKVQVSPVKRFWRGQPKTRPFQLFVRPEGGLPITLDGTLLQESVLPPWFLKALIALIVLLIALVLIWLLLLKPSIQTAATRGGRVAAREPRGGRQRGARARRPAHDRPRGERRQRRDRAALGRGAVRRGAASGGSRRRPPPRPSTPGVVIPGLGNAGRRRASTAPIRRSTSDGTLFLTDFVFSNPNGREGAIVVLRNDTPLMQLRLENFRDYDLHFVTPIVHRARRRAQPRRWLHEPRVMRPAVFYSGYLRP